MLCLPEFMSCCSFLLYYITVSFVTYEDVSASKQRDKMRLKILSFFGSARIRIDCGTLIASLMLLHLSVLGY